MKQVRSSSLSSLYYQYKDTTIVAAAIFVLVILVSICLVLFFVIPQFQHWLDSNTEVEDLRTRVAALNDNITFLQNLDSNAVDSQFQEVITALPVDKAFGDGMQQILSSAVSSGVNLNSFQFSVGEVGTKSATPKVVTTDTPLQITVEAQGDGLAMKDFVTSLTQRIPLSQITTIKQEEGGLGEKVVVTFPNEPIKDASFDKSTPIAPLTAHQRSLLDQLNQWQTNSQDTTGSTSSSSATLPPPF